MPAARFTSQIFLLSLAAILLEISYTRILSFKLVYYFTYLVIALALLGLGAGGIALTLVPRLRAWSTDRLVARASLFTAVTVFGGYLVMALVQVNAFDIVQALGQGDTGVAWRESAKLALLALLLATPFFGAGVAITAILSTQPAHVNRLYFADLAGAALGCAASVPAMTVLSPPGCIMLAGAVAALAAWTGLQRAARGVAIALTGVLLVLAVRPSALPDPVCDRVKTMAPGKTPHNVLFSRWHPVFRVDLLEPTAEFLQGQQFKLLVHDGTWGSVMSPYDGNPASLAYYDRDARALPFSVLPPAPRVMIIGAAGGNEILASLRRDAAHVTAVELNPVTVSLLTDHFADYVGRLAENPKVQIVPAEGRTYLMRSRDAYDLVWFVAPDSYAAMNAATAGAFVLSESYLYTVEMIADSLERLAPGGIVAIQFGEVDFEGKPNRTLRYLVSAREALEKLGIEDAGRHLLVATSAGFVFNTATVLVKREPFTPDETQRFRAAVGGLTGARIRWAPPDEPAGPVATVVGGSENTLERFLADWPYAVTAVHDDAPFFWHFVSFRKALRLTPGGLDTMEHGLGEQLLMVLLVCAGTLAALLLAAPLLLRRRRWRDMPGKVAAGTYFAALGLGFMFFEISLIQRLTLFLGYPTYSLTVTLCAVLVSTALGALWGGRVVTPPATLLPRLLGCLLGLVLFYRLGLPIVIDHFIGTPLAVRITIAVAMLLPLGLCLGTFMPLGLRTVSALGAHGEDYAAWAWAVNGFFSVIASLLATMLAMTYGFDTVMLIALGVYAVGIVAFSSLARRTAPA
jgi:hypothetical protein